MKTQLRNFALGFLTVFAGVAMGATFNLFQPATGVLKGNASTYVTTAAVSADIRGLWTGSCDATTFLRGDGACAFAVVAPAGANTQIQYNNSGAFGASSSFTFNSATNVVNLGAGTTPGTFSVGQLDTMVVNGVAVPIPGFSLNSNIQGVIENHSYVSGGPTGGARYYGVRSRGSITTPAIVQSGDHLNSIFAAGYNGSAYSLAGQILFTVGNTPGAADMPGDLDFLLSPDGSQTPTSRLKLFNTGAIGISGSQGTSGQVLTSNGTGTAASWSTLPGSFTGFANPTASVGLAAVNGAATTAMRSDAAPALDQGIVPTWTGVHTFSANPIVSSADPRINWCNSSAPANSKCSNYRVDSTGSVRMSITNDALSPQQNWLTMDRSVGVVTNLSFGNATDNPTYTFAGTGAVTVTGNISAANLSSGTYTPTLTNVTNVDASTSYVATYLRVGNSVTVTGRVDIDTTLGAATTLAMSLPIASNFAAGTDAGGVAAAANIQQSGAVRADSVNDRVNLEYSAIGTSNIGMFYSYTYRIL